MGRPLGRLGQLDRPGAVSHRSVRAGRQDPCQTVAGWREVRLDLQRLLEMGHRLPHLSFLLENLAEIVVGECIGGTDLQCLLVVSDGLLHLSLLPENVGEIVVVLGTVGVDLQRLL